MFQGNWTCSKCGGEIKELPFEPRSTSGLTCRDCYFKEKNGGAASSSSTSSDSAAASDIDTGASGDLDDRNDVPPFDPDASGVAGEPAPTDPEREAAPAASGDRKLFQGDWKCSLCGNPITELPFEPRSTENLKCIDCFKKSKG